MGRRSHVGVTFRSAVPRPPTPPPLLLVGTRGVGKTMLLAGIARRAGAERGWPRLRAEATPRTHPSSTR